MPVTALITFEQLAASPGAGISMVGVGGSAVTLTNDDDTGVISWTWELLDSPMNSALVPGSLGTTASATFTPDSGPETPGCYRIQLTVRGVDGSVACDVKNFAVETVTGWVLPPFKATAAELNFPGNDEGWESLLNEIFLDLAVGGGTDELVKVSGTDTTAELLAAKLVSGTNVTVNVLNPGAVEQLEIVASDEKVAISGTDTTPADLESKVVAGNNIVVTKLNTGFNEQIEISTSEAIGSIQTFSITLPLSGVSDTTFNAVGELRIDDFSRAVATGQTGLNYATDFNVSNQHGALNVTSLTGTGIVTITGTSLSESTSVPITSDTEVLVVDATGRYQTGKKWWEITDITFSGGISAVTYDVEVIGYSDALNQDFKVLGYRADIYTSSGLADLGIEIWKVDDLGSGKWDLVQLEGIGFDSGSAGNQIVDSLRSGGADRTYNPTVSSIVGNNETITFKQGDFDSYFSSGENEIHASTSDEGIVIRFRGEDGAGGGGISAVDQVVMSLYVQRI